MFKHCVLLSVAVVVAILTGPCRIRVCALNSQSKESTKYPGFATPKPRRLSSRTLSDSCSPLAKVVARCWARSAGPHQADPARPFVLPVRDPNAPEVILAPRFNTIAKARPDRAKSAGMSAVDRLQVPKTQRKLKKVMDMDFSDASKSVDVLVKLPASEISKNALLRLVDRKYAQLGVQRTTQGEAAAAAENGCPDVTDSRRVYRRDQRVPGLGSR